MSLKKYTNVEAVLEVKTGNRIKIAGGDQPGSQLTKFAALEDGFRKEDGYLYVRCRAISSRVNKNNDGWPSQELERSYKSFIGRPIFVDHHNDDPKRTRGVIVDAQLHVDDDKTSALDPYYSTAPDNHKPPTWIELLMEIDAQTFPKLAAAIENGDMDAVSMGANIDKSVCSVCDNEASTSEEYCSHVRQKGITFEVTADNGEKVRKKAYEDCYGITFFEISNVFDPADPTADSWLDGTRTAALKESAEERGLNWDEVQAYLAASGRKLDFDVPSLSEMVGKKLPLSRVASMRTADMPAEQFIKPLDQKHPSEERNHIPQVDQITAPEEVNTLRQDNKCPICRAANMEAGADGIMSCPVCGHVQEPEPFDNPDLGLANEMDLRQDQNAEVDQSGNPAVNAENPLDQVEFSPSPMPMAAAIKPNITNEGISEMFTSKLRTESKKEADAILPVKTGRVEAKFGANGVHRGIYKAAHDAGLKVRVTYAALGETEDRTLEVPGDNGIFNILLAEESAERLGLGRDQISEVPIIVEADTEEDAKTFVTFLNTIERPTSRKREAAGEKQPLLPASAKPTDEQKKEKVVSDALAPRETKTVTVTDDKVEMDGKSYRLVSVEEDEEKEEPQASAEGDSEDKPAEEKADKKTETDEEAVDTSKAEELAEEASEDRESKLLLAFTLADSLVALGMIQEDHKMAIIADLEGESFEQLLAREATLKQVKVAGLGKRAKNIPSGIRPVPRLSHTPVSSPSVNGTMDFPDEAIFL